MNIEQQLTSFELSRKLKELGVKQESYFCWTTENDLEFLHSDIRNEDVCIAAFSVAELGDMFPLYFESGKRENDDWVCRYFSKGYEEPIMHHHSFDETEANARAKILIHLIENNLMTPEWREQWLEK